MLDLHDPDAARLSLTGGKAAALARAAANRIPTVPGVVLTTAVARDIDDGAAVGGHPAVLEAFQRAGGEHHRLVARSSSVVEDTATSSMAGQFESVIGISGFDDFSRAVETVLSSRALTGTADQPMAVLVQRHLEPAFGGVLFGIDPVSGRSDRRVISAVRGGPDRLVSGEVQGSRYVLDANAAVVEFDQNDGPALSRQVLRRLIGLSATVAGVYGSPQDVEWAIDEQGVLWLLQSRPVTTAVLGVPSGPVYGPGPVAETFPEPLTELEHDLWIPPLRDAVRHVALLTGTATTAELAASQVVITVAGRAAIDLRLAGQLPRRRGILQRLDPRPPLRRLTAAWRVGRLRSAIPALADDLLRRVDADLRAMPPLGGLSDRQLLAVLHRSRDVLRSLHGHEILLGMLTDTGGNRMTGASVALRVLVEARRDGLDDQTIIEHSPIVLGLTPPRVAPRPILPGHVTDVPLGGDRESANDNGILREALRLRVRWLQELSGRAAWTLGCRLAATGDLPDPELVRHIDLDHLDAIVTRRAVLVPTLVSMHEHLFGAPLPARFQLSDSGLPVPVRQSGHRRGGTGAGGGVGRGMVTHDADDPPAGSILVTTVLTPGLGPKLDRLNGIVAETGSVLSHLAILAREARVPTVVGYAGAGVELPPGTQVAVDGDSGRVTVLEVAS